MEGCTCFGIRDSACLRHGDSPTFPYTVSNGIRSLPQTRPDASAVHDNRQSESAKLGSGPAPSAADPDEK